MYKYLAQFSAKVDQIQSENQDNPVGDEEHKQTPANSSASKKTWLRNYENLSESDRQQMLADEIFAYYLYTISRKVNEHFYKTVLTYTILFRECLNEIGWVKKIESEGLKVEEDDELKAKVDTEPFCLTNNTEHAPEICNEFVTVFMERKRNQVEIPKPDQIDLTINVCHWLFENQFTCSKLTMIS